MSASFTLTVAAEPFIRSHVLRVGPRSITRLCRSTSKVIFVAIRLVDSGSQRRFSFPIRRGQRMSCERFTRQRNCSAFSVQVASGDLWIAKPRFSSLPQPNAALFAKKLQP